MNTTLKRISALTIAALIMTILVSFVISDNAYAAVRLSNKKLIIGRGAKFSLKVKGTKKKVKWSSTNKNIAIVSKKGVVKGKKIGECYVKAKVGKKTLKCKVIVRIPQIANAMNLRNYILKNGKKASDGGYYIQKKGKVPASTDEEYMDENIVVKAYKDTTEMYFESREDALKTSDGYMTQFIMTIDMIRAMPAKDVWIKYTCDDNSYDLYYADLGYNFFYDSGSPDDTDAISVTQYEKFDGVEDHTPQTYTDAATLEYVKNNAAAQTRDAFLLFDSVFKKYKLKSRMNKLGFKKLTF